MGLRTHNTIHYRKPEPVLETTGEIDAIIASGWGRVHHVGSARRVVTRGDGDVRMYGGEVTERVEVADHGHFMGCGSPEIAVAKKVGSLLLVGNPETVIVRGGAHATIFGQPKHVHVENSHLHIDSPSAD